MGSASDTYCVCLALGLQRKPTNAKRDLWCKLLKRGNCLSADIHFERTNTTGKNVPVSRNAMPGMHYACMVMVWDGVTRHAKCNRAQSRMEEDHSLAVRVYVYSQPSQRGRLKTRQDVTLLLAASVTSCVIVEVVKTHIVSVNGTVIFSFCMLSTVLFVTRVW